jgi:hypothetical protein
MEDVDPVININDHRRRRPSTKVCSCDRADRNREVEAWVEVTCGSFLLLTFILVALTHPFAPIFVLLLSAALSLLLLGSGRFVLCSQTREAPSRWHQGDGTVEFGPSWGFLLWEQIPPLMVTIGVALALWMPLPPDITHSEARRTMRFAWGLLAGSVLMWTFMPVNPPRAPELILDPLGIRLWPDGRHHTYIPWELNPLIEGSSGRQFPRAVITTNQGRTSLFPMSPIPLGYVQLQRVVEFYSTHPELRDELATGTGLNRVRTLMHTPVRQVEESLSAARSASTAPGRQDRSRDQGTVSPRRAITPVDDAIASLAAMLNGRPEGTDPMPAWPTQADEPDELDEPDEPAMPARPPLPEPPPPTPTPRGALG